MHVCSGEAISFVEEYIFFLNNWKLIVSSDKFKVFYQDTLMKTATPFLPWLVVNNTEFMKHEQNKF